MTSAYAYTSAIWPPLICAVILVAVSLFGWRRRAQSGALPLAAGSLLGAVWMLGLVLVAAAADPSTKIAWYKFQAAWQIPTVTAMTCFALEYTWPGRWLTRRNLSLLAAPSVLGVIMLVTRGSQPMWRSLELGPDGLIVPTFNTPGKLIVGFGLSLFVVNAAALLWLAVHSPRHRWPVALILGGQLAARGLYLLDLSYRSSPVLRESFVIGMFLVWCTYAIALFGFRIFDPLPAARQAVIEQMQTGVVVFDANWRVLSLNPAAECIFGVRSGLARNKPWQELAPPGTPLSALPEMGTEGIAAAIGSIDMICGNGPDTRHYTPALTLLRDFRGLLTGRLLLLHDITEQKRAQALALEQQRVTAMLDERERLARELHDDLGQVLGYVKMQAQAARDRLARDQKAEADEYLSQLMSAAQQAHAGVREYILGVQTAADGQRDFLQALGLYLRQFTANHGIRSELLAPSELGPGALGPVEQAHLLRIIQEALTNARKHAHARCVQVHVQLEGSQVRVIIQDDGVGFDPAQTAGSLGFGMRSMRTRAEEVNGSLVVMSSPGQGTQVVVQIPLRA